MKKILLLSMTIFALSYTSAQVSIQNPNSFCDAHAHKTSTQFVFEFSDPAIWGWYIAIRPIDQNGNKGIGKMYLINSSNGIVSFPLSHGILLASPNGYHFVIEEVYNPNGNTSFCGFDYWIPL